MILNEDNVVILNKEHVVILNKEHVVILNEEDVVILDEDNVMILDDPKRLNCFFIDNCAQLLLPRQRSRPQQPPPRTPIKIAVKQSFQGIIIKHEI